MYCAWESTVRVTRAIAVIMDVFIQAGRQGGSAWVTHRDGKTLMVSLMDVFGLGHDQA